MFNCIGAYEAQRRQVETQQRLARANWESYQEYSAIRDAERTGHAVIGLVFLPSLGFRVPVIEGRTNIPKTGVK